jgi:site-specific DNA-methyltransferase (adenine-specific)
MDCLGGMKLIPDNSIDSIVTDPPYELGFMGKEWDKTGIAYNIEVWKECLRILKHGGHLLAFGGTRTYHRMVCAIEDAGFEIRDQMQWIYGSGFPKSMDISKAIDKREGAEREKIINPLANKQTAQVAGKGLSGAKNAINFITPNPITDEAKQWDGWGTALKPANEPIVVARKPLSERTVAENVLKWGTGGINIDDCRIEHNEPVKTTNRNGRENASVMNDESCGFDNTKNTMASADPKGRFPANIIFDEEAAKMLDEQSGTLKSGGGNKGNVKNGTGLFGNGKSFDTVNFKANSGGASRFFYCAKASKSERGENNIHPTVKPIKLIEYLIKLITPPNGISLDPFEGSGTHGVACKELGFNYIGFEISKEYCEIANKRIESVTKVGENT